MEKNLDNCHTKESIKAYKKYWKALPEVNENFYRIETSKDNAMWIMSHKISKVITVQIRNTYFNERVVINPQIREWLLKSPMFELNMFDFVFKAQ